MATKEYIYQKCLGLIGAEAIKDFTNKSDKRIDTLDQCYEGVKAKLLSLRIWTFAVTRAKITALTDEEDKPVENTEDVYKYEFELPTDMVRVISVSRFAQLNNFYQDYEIRGCKLLANAPTLFIKYIKNPTEAEMPAYFADLLAGVLAEETCFKLTGDKVLQQGLQVRNWGNPSDNLKGGWFGFTAKIDAAQNPTRRLQSRPMINARFERVD